MKQKRRWSWTEKQVRKHFTQRHKQILPKTNAEYIWYTKANRTITKQMEREIMTTPFEELDNLKEFNFKPKGLVWWYFW